MWPGWAVVVALGMGVFVGGFDQTFVVPVLSRILGDLDIAVDEFGQASWVVNGYLLGYTVAMPLMGRMADVHGHLRVFVAGLLIFMAGSVLVALSPNLPALTIARAVTALGGGALVPVALAMSAAAVSDRRRPLALGTISTLDDSSSLAGPLWGTLIGVWIGWRGLFWMNVVLALPVLVAVLVVARSTSPSRSEESVDWVGGGLLALALGLVTVLLAGVGSLTATPAAAIALGVAAVAALVAFAWWESRVARPLVDLATFRSRGSAVSNAVFFLEGAALITALVNVPLMTEVLWGRGGAAPGLMLGRMVLFMAVGGIAGGVLASLAGYRVSAALGACLACSGLFLIAAWPEQPGELARWTALAVAGLGFTLADASLYATVMDGVRTSRRASATAMLQVSQSMGMVVGMALLASQGLGRFDQRAADLFAKDLFDVSAEQYRAIVHRTLDETFVIAALAMVLATLLSLLLPAGRASGQRERRWSWSRGAGVDSASR